MPIKKTAFAIKGMSRDISPSKFSQEYAYENMNMRILATDINTGGSLTNERGPLKKGMFFKGYSFPANATSWGGQSGWVTVPDETKEIIHGIPIGKVEFNDEFVLFVTNSAISEIDNLPDDNTNISLEEVSGGPDMNLFPEYGDAIYKFWFDNDVLNGKLLYRGNLGFDYKHPIEGIGVYENKDVKKVYWTDGINQPRMINIAASDAVRATWESNSFDFVKELNLYETVDIERIPSSSGLFFPGTIQYCFTYYSKFGQESNIFHVSPLYYISHQDRGGEENEEIGCNFKIRIENADSSYDYVRIYSIQRTSQNSPRVSLVSDVRILGDTVEYIDDNIGGTDLSSDRLLFLGGDKVLAQTMYDKDNVLFLGNLTYEKITIPSSIVGRLRSHNVPVYKNNEQELPLLSTEAKMRREDGYYTYINQLQYNSNQIKGFKYLETYRFGVQFQDKTGKWSDPVWLGDVRNNSVHHHSFIFREADNVWGKVMNNTLAYPIAETTLRNIDTDTSINYNDINDLVSLGYVSARPVVVYPQPFEREAVCQGVLCPTVFNFNDRINNAPFAQSSWFFRPNAPCDVDTQSGANASWRDYDEIHLSLSEESKAASVAIDTKAPSDGVNQPIYELPTEGAWATFRHYSILPPNNKRNCEIQCNTTSMDDFYTGLFKCKSLSEIKGYLAKYRDVYAVDQSVITMHSPEIEFDPSLKSRDLSHLKLRIVGAVPFTGFNSNVDIDTGNSITLKNPENGRYYSGLYKEGVKAQDGSTHGWKELISAPMWRDGCKGYDYDDDSVYDYNGWLYVVYPWHRSGSLNNYDVPDAASGNALPSELKHKVLTNMRFSRSTMFVSEDKVWKDRAVSAYKKGLSGIGIVDSNDAPIVKLPGQKNDLPEITYFGNYDRVLTTDDGYTIYYGAYNPALIEREDDWFSYDAHLAFVGDYMSIAKSMVNNPSWTQPGDPIVQPSTVTTITKGNDVVSLKYKSSPHIVMSLKVGSLNFNDTITYIQPILPTTRDCGTNYVNYANSGRINEGMTYFNFSTPYLEENYTMTDDVKQLFFENGLPLLIHQDRIDFPWEDEGTPPAISSRNRTTRFGYLWLGELYNDDITEETRFGGNTEDAIQRNIWYPCGEAVSLIDPGTKSIKNEVTLKWTEGDTYYQRYDCMKTYPYTNEDPNSMIETLSFMCETKVNIDGRYDKNRNSLNNFSLSPDVNYNKINKGYTQDNNYFTYNITDPDIANIKSFPNTVYWSLPKTFGEDIDSWTNVTLANTLDFDGNRGEIRKIIRYNNALLAFQDSAISQILYNENVQISSTEGVPIEIANSGKVSGKRTIAEGIGCSNKWSICLTPAGIYFMDSNTKDIYRFSEQLDNLSENQGFHSWVLQNFPGIKTWNPVDFEGCVTYYDKINSDVLFITKEQCLAYSELLNSFSSFYSYEEMPYLCGVEDKEVAWHKDNSLGCSPWVLHEGNYNNFFGEYKPYWVTVIANPEPFSDKTFNNIEFQADSFGGDEYIPNYTFDKLEAWNEYQHGESDLSNILDTPSTLKKKFRTWYANIPRNNIGKENYKVSPRDRMRNPWLFIKLMAENENNYRTVLHNLVVDYFE